jgi:fucose 4-O-acetylase-like acetyltransferase
MNSLQTINNNKYMRLNIKNEKPIFDIGLAILRPILSFFVIMTHCYKYSYATGLWKFLIFKTKKFYFHVPIFFLMSFYFSQKTLSSSNTKKKAERFERLCIPYFFYPIILFLLNKLLIRFKITKNEIQIDELKHQLLFGIGMKYLFILWYQWNIIFFTFFFILVICLFRKNYNFVLIIILITSFVFQYNGKNVLIFGKYKERMVLGRVMEMLPFSVIGFLISYSDIIHFLKNFRLKVFIYCIYFLYFLYIQQYNGI